MLESKIEKVLNNPEIIKSKPIKKEESTHIELNLDTKKKLIKVTAIGTTGLAILKGTLTQGILIEKAILDSSIAYLTSSSLSFLGALAIPNYFMIAMVVACGLHVAGGIKEVKNSKSKGGAKK